MSRHRRRRIFVEAALYLIPVTLGGTSVEAVLPAYNHQIIMGIHHFIVENIRSARRFLKAVDKSVDIDSLTFYELNEHTNPRDITSYLEPLKNGNAMGVISEAGCPAIADPGALVVEMAQKKNLKVVPLVGPSSIILSLMASGFNGQNFAFNGYLPAKPGDRKTKLHQLENKIWKENQTQLFIEAPYRNAQMFESILSSCRGDTKLCVATALTCPDEYIHTHTIAEWKKLPLPQFQKIPTIFLLYK